MGCSLCYVFALHFIPLTPLPARAEPLKTPLGLSKTELVQEGPSRRLIVLCGDWREMISPGVSWGADAKVSSGAAGPLLPSPHSHLVTEHAQMDCTGYDLVPWGVRERRIMGGMASGWF